MSKKHPVPRAESGKAPVKGTSHHNWLTPVSDTAPCGPDLEYDHDFVVLFASAAPKHDVQYGAFVGSPEASNWSELERDCRRLMTRTKDIRVASLFTRCRTRLAGAAGLAEGTGMLAAWLQTFADGVHPRPGADNEREAMLEMRMNALQALADPEGLLADVREIVLTRSTVARLQVRDVERAFAHPRPADALAPESVAQQLNDLHAEHPAVMAGFDEAIAHVATIGAWCAEHLDTFQPDFSPLSRLLQHLRTNEPQLAPEPDVSPTVEIDSDGATDAPGVVRESSGAPLTHEGTGPRDFAPVAPPRANAAPVDRHAALALIRTARHWFETNEPSSPIPVLLKRAEQFVGKRYADVVRAIPAELLEQWDDSNPA